MLNLPTTQQNIDRLRADIKSVLPESNPYEVTSIINALCVAFGGRISEVYEQLLILQRDQYATTAELQALLIIGQVYGLSLNPATSASGLITLTGIAGTIVHQFSAFQSTAGEEYTTQSSVTLSANTININSITRAGTTATVTTASNHNLGSGMEIVIAGANETDYNGTFEIVVTGLDTFTYQVANSPSSPATGTITASYTGASVEVVASNTGQSTNVLGGATLTATASIAGLDGTGYVQYSGIDGGSDIETTEEFRTRLLFRIQNPFTPFNEATIISTAKEISGVTRVWVFEPNEINTSDTPSSINAIATDYAKITFSTDHDLLDGMKVVVSGANEAAFNGTFRVIIVSNTEVVYYSSGVTGSATGSLNVAYSNVQLGQVRIFFVRDNDPSIIPSANEVSTVETAILALKPANTADQDVIVAAPTEKAIDFDFTALSPDTSGLRTSIELNLQALFKDTDIGATITQDQYRTAIQNSFDSETGQGVSSFTLSTPTSSQTSAYNEILTLGNITYTI
jgi:uncharacterized phage protein gp47/JayE